MEKITHHPNVTGKKLLPRRETCKRYGVCARTVKRWELDPELNFPPPTVINNRNYDHEDRLGAWDEWLASQRRQVA